MIRCSMIGPGPPPAAVGTPTSGRDGALSTATDATGMALIMPERERIAKRLRAFGYRFVTLDLAGYRSDSLNPPDRPARRGAT